MTVSSSYFYNNFYNSQVTQQRRGQSISSLIDKDKDKTLSADELSAFTVDYSKKTGAELDITSLMEAYDSDGDGLINESEQESMTGDKALEQLLFAGRPFPKERVGGMPPMAEAVESIDENGDKLWNSDELTRFADLFNEATGGELSAESLMTEYDADGDGSLNGDEQAEMMSKILPPPPMPPAQNGFETDLTVSGLSVEGTETAESETDKYTALRETLQEIYLKIQETLEEKDAESKTVESITEENEFSQMLMAMRASKAASTYENAFWYQDSSAGLFQKII